MCSHSTGVVLGLLTPPVLVRVLETLVPRQSDEEEDDDFLLDRQEVRVTASLAKYGNRSAETSCVCTQGHTCLPTYSSEYILLYLYMFRITLT